MKSSIDRSIVLDPMAGPAVNEADCLLTIIVGPSAYWASANWKLKRDPKDRKVITLTMSDPDGAVSAEFVPDELTRPYHLYSRLNRVWGELLQFRVEKQLERVDEAIPRTVEA